MKFREILSSQFDERLIVSNFDRCLWAYPVSEWQKIEEKVAALPQFNPQVKALQRVFISAACECPVDKQGRILIPPTLREYAGLKRDIVMVGMVKRIEIWDKERWSKVFDESQDLVSGSGESLADLGL
jgi:MraZ protein